MNQLHQRILPSIIIGEKPSHSEDELVECIKETAYSFIPLKLHERVRSQELAGVVVVDLTCRVRGDRRTALGEEKTLEDEEQIAIKSVSRVVLKFSVGEDKPWFLAGCGLGAHFQRRSG